MSYFGEVAAGTTLPAFTVLRDQFGFVPKLFSAQILLPRLIDAEAALLSSILFRDGSLKRPQRECILLAVAAARSNAYCFSLHYQMLRLLGLSEQRLDRIVACYEQTDLSPVNKALLRFAMSLVEKASSFSSKDVDEALSSQRLTDEALLDAVLTTALAVMLCTLSTGVGADPDFGHRPNRSLLAEDKGDRSPAAEKKPRFHLLGPDPNSNDSKPFSWLRGQFGFVPDVFRAQTLRRDVVEAEVFAVQTVLTPEDALARVEKLRLLLANPGSDGSRTERDHALAGFAAKLSSGTESSRTDIEELREQGFSERETLEAVVVISLSNFFDVLQSGLGVAADFAAHKINEKKAHLPVPDLRHTGLEPSADPDAESVARVQAGDLKSFEELMTRHHRRVYRTLIGILGNRDDAQDAMQDTFLKAFQHLPRFEGRSKFSTWLLSIAHNTGVQHLRERRPMESLDETSLDEETFRPRQVQAWVDNPEGLYSQAQVRLLIEGGVMKLPAKCRVVLMLRDIEQLSIEDTAGALGLSIAATKARLLRGRLMLREALAPDFAAQRSGGHAKGLVC
jgi:RNA polymerase sigma-70 factor (ECF subfamily)